MTIVYTLCDPLISFGAFFLFLVYTLRHYLSEFLGLCWLTLGVHFISVHLLS